MNSFRPALILLCLARQPGQLTCMRRAKTLVGAVTIHSAPVSADIMRFCRHDKCVNVPRALVVHLILNSTTNLLETVMGTILLILLVIMLLGAFPAWPYSRGWGYYPSGGLGPGAGGHCVAGRDGPHSLVTSNECSAAKVICLRPPSGRGSCSLSSKTAGGNFLDTARICALQSMRRKS